MSQDSTLRTALRTHTLGALAESDVGTQVQLCGWVHRRRDLGGLVFLDLRDRYGIVQVSLGPDWTEGPSLERAAQIGLEDVVRVAGVVRSRPGGARNEDMATGGIEVQATEFEVLNAARTPAIPVYRGPEDELPSEDLRLRHRVLDLRRPELQANLILRHRIVLEIRRTLDSLGFLEMETPILTKPTPEGARDFLVPSRQHPGMFFALPQSPQLYKQILIAAGFDRYFQIARCFRDEDLRADRQPEFTQLDVEAAFVAPEDIFSWMEGVMTAVARVGGVEAEAPFARITWAESMERYGSDRPDLRTGLAIQDWSGDLGAIESTIVQNALADGGRVRGLRVTGGASLSRKQIEGLEAVAKKEGAPGLFWAKVTEDGATGPLGKFLNPEALAAIGAETGDLLLVAAGPDRMILPALGAVRVPAAQAAGHARDTEHSWIWVTEFPLFELDDSPSGALAANHHPFVLPHPDDAHLLDSEPLRVRGLAYDLVYNGAELGSGSLRNHDARVQRAILARLGLGEEEMQTKFGFLLDTLESGAPPHGGIALGIDRIVQGFAAAPSLRDVIAFPKTTAGRALFEGAPTPLSDAELGELHLERLK